MGACLFLRAVNTMLALFGVLILCGAVLQVNADDAARVSWKECNLDPGLRVDCGYHGIKEEKCYERECCFAETHAMGTPWCYHSIPTLSKKCTVSDSERIDCGFYGIRKEQCLHQGCCWQPTNANVPWCYQTKVIPMQPSDCGTPAIAPSVNTEGRIVGGEDARRNSWPWQVSLQMDGSHFCGASIVNEKWVVTAAHCAGAFSWGTVEVVVGQHMLSERSSEQSQRIEVKEYYKHDDFDYDSGSNELSDDIMLLQLMSPIQFNDAVSPVCIPDQGEEFKAGMRCHATGWGTTRLGGSSPDTLQQVTVPLLKQETCEEWYADPQNWYDSAGNAPPVTDKMICAGFEEGGRGTCHGDSGGPMVCYSDHKWKLVGVVSWGGPCAHERTPSVFARVSQYNDWMKKLISDKDDSK